MCFLFHDSKSTHKRSNVLKTWPSYCPFVYFLYSKDAWWIKGNTPFTHSQLFWLIYHKQSQLPLEQEILEKPVLPSTLKHTWDLCLQATMTIWSWIIGNLTTGSSGRALPGRCTSASCWQTWRGWELVHCAKWVSPLTGSLLASLLPAWL